MVVSFAKHMPLRNSLILFGGSVLAAFVALDRWKSRLVVSERGVTVEGLWTTDVPWSQIGSYRVRDTRNFWTPADFGELLLWPFAIFYRYLIAWPLRTLLRWLFVRDADDRRFLDYELVLRDRDGKRLVAIAGSDRFVGGAAAVRRIVETFHALPPPPFAIEGVAIDAIAALDVGKTTKVTTATGTQELDTDDVPNIYLVIDAVRARGGAVDVRTFVP